MKLLLVGDMHLRIKAPLRQVRRKQKGRGK